MTETKDFLLVTVDCDLRSEDASLRQDSLEQLAKVFAQEGARGHITWFLNEKDFSLTENHQDFLREVLKRGDALGIDDHLDSLEGDLRKEQVLVPCREAKKKVEEWLKGNGYAQEIICHRNGHLVQHQAIYEALRELGYKVISDIWPGNSKVASSPGIGFDNRPMPIGIAPYRHDPHNFLDYTSRQGAFLQVPVMHQGLEDLDFDHLRSWVEAFRARGIAPGLLVWLIHPYEILNETKTAVDKKLVGTLRSHLLKAKWQYQLTFKNLAEALAEREE